MSGGAISAARRIKAKSWFSPALYVRRRTSHYPGGHCQIKRTALSEQIAPTRGIGPRHLEPRGQPHERKDHRRRPELQDIAGRTDTRSSVAQSGAGAMVL